MLPTFTGFSHGVNQKVQKLVARGQRVRRTEGGGDPVGGVRCVRGQIVYVLGRLQVGLFIRFRLACSRTRPLSACRRLVSVGRRTAAARQSRSRAVCAAIV